MAEPEYVIAAQWISRCATRIREIRKDLSDAEAQGMGSIAYERCRDIHPIEAAETLVGWGRPPPPPPSDGGSAD